MEVQCSKYINNYCKQNQLLLIDPFSESIIGSFQSRVILLITCYLVNLIILHFYLAKTKPDQFITYMPMFWRKKVTRWNGSNSLQLKIHTLCVLSLYNTFSLVIHFTNCTSYGSELGESSNFIPVIKKKH